MSFERAKPERSFALAWSRRPLIREMCFSFSAAWADFTTLRERPSGSNTRSTFGVCRARSRAINSVFVEMGRELIWSLGAT